MHPTDPLPPPTPNSKLTRELGDKAAHVEGICSEQNVGRLHGWHNGGHEEVTGRLLSQGHLQPASKASADCMGDRGGG